MANSVGGLTIPHFVLGLGIGILDAALTPLLASLVDAKYSDDDSTSSKTILCFIFLFVFLKVSSITGDSLSNYGAVYAIQQMSVSLAYSLGPFIGGETAQYIGFTWLMFVIGACNILYATFLLVQLINASMQVYLNFFL